MVKRSVQGGGVRLFICLGILLVVAASPGWAAGKTEGPLPGATKLLRYADISRDNVVFDYAGDLWVAPRKGGDARRLTAHVGSEIFPKFSPDGRTIAFSGEYDGNLDVYLIPTTGGEPRRLTYHPAGDVVLGWTPDGKHVLFRSDRITAPPHRTTRLFLVSPDGGPVEVLPVPRGDLTSFSPDGGKIAYLPTSQEFRTWKRYRGGWSLPIAIYDLEKNTYEELPKSNGMDMFPMWHGKTIYFISDRDRVMNLYAYDLGTKQTRKLTDYKEYDIKWPSLGPDAIVYQNGGLLYQFDLASEKTSEIPIKVHAEDLQARPELKNVALNIETYGISPSGARAVVAARGNLITLPAKKGSPRNLTDSSSVHEMNPAWSPDGKWIAYLSDKTGEYEVYYRPQMGGPETRVTTDGGVYRYGPVWSPDSKKLLYWDKLQRLYWVGIDEKKPVLVDQGEYGDISDGSWSPDSLWIAYSKADRRQAGQMYLYSLDSKKSAKISSGFYSDTNPVFDPEGKYLFFLSQRYFFPSSGQLDNRFNYYTTDGVFAITLKADEASPFAPQSDEEKPAAGKEEEKKDDKKGGEDGSGAAKKADAGEKEAGKDDGGEEAVKPIMIDLDGIQDRVTPAPISSGMFSRLSGRKGKLFYLSQPEEARDLRPGHHGTPQNVLHVFDIDKREDKTVLQGIDGYVLDKDGGKILYKAGPVYGIVDSAPGKSKVGDGKIDTGSLQVMVDPREEWRQIYHEAWRIERDFYWDPNMTGHDWKRLGDRYEALLPWVVTRGDLTYLIGELISELSTSHTYVGGGDVPHAPPVSVGMLGADYEPDGGYYEIKKIYPGENWGEATRSPLTQPGLKVKAGDYLIAVNGIEARADQSVYAYFQNLAGKVVTLKINDKPSAEGAWEIVVKPTGDENGVRYLDWIDHNRRKVEEATGGRIGYMHVPDTAIPGIIAFDKQFNAQLDKDGLIVDERDNSGGYVPDFYTEKLERRFLAAVAPRDGKDITWPQSAIYGPKVMIVNELAGSGGDAFPWLFRREKIGPIVGTRTWGGLVGIGGNQPLRDGGYVTAPGFAFWSTDESGKPKWIVENHGVDPDYVVPQRPDLVVEGHDPQLEKAIELAKEALKSYKGVPKRPPFPEDNR